MHFHNKCIEKPAGKFLRPPQRVFLYYFQMKRRKQMVQVNLEISIIYAFSTDRKNAFVR